MVNVSFIFYSFFFFLFRFNEKKKKNTSFLTHHTTIIFMSSSAASLWALLQKLIKWPFIFQWIALNEAISTIDWLVFDVFCDHFVIPAIILVSDIIQKSFITRLVVSQETLKSLDISRRFIKKVRLQSGIALGRTKHLAGYTKFEAIQYATAERFQLAQKLPPVSPHDDDRTLNVTPTCFPQTLTPLNFDRFPLMKSAVQNISSFISRGYLGSEIGHQLNIWTPVSFDPENRDQQQLLPVLFVFHGGAYIFSSAHQSFIDGSSWATRDFVVVAANWRLALSGFLFHPEMDRSQLTPNLGLHDAIFALRWVRDNIYKFGGDKNSVTVLGQSCGSMLIGKLCSIKHVVDEEKLFHKAVMMSGGSQLVLTSKVASQIYFETAVATGFISSMKEVSALSSSSSFDHKSFATHLRSLSTNQLVKAQGRVIFDCLRDYFSCERGYITPFAPCVDGELIKTNPIKQMKENGTCIPCFLGTTESECTLFSDIRRRNHETQQETEARLLIRLRSWLTETKNDDSVLLDETEHQPLVRQLFDAYREGHYLKRLAKTADVSWIALNTDFAFRVPVENFANVMTSNQNKNKNTNSKNDETQNQIHSTSSSSSSSPCFMYCFSNPSLIARLGSPHVADLPYFFDVLRQAQPVSGLWTPARIKLKNKMMNDVENFMRGRFDKLWKPWSDVERPVYFYDSREENADGEKLHYFSGLVHQPDHGIIEKWRPINDLFLEMA